jgi:hypothetical protein
MHKDLTPLHETRSPIPSGGASGSWSWQIRCYVAGWMLIIVARLSHIVWRGSDDPFWLTTLLPAVAGAAAVAMLGYLVYVLGVARTKSRQRSFNAQEQIVFALLPVVGLLVYVCYRP